MFLISALRSNESFVPHNGSPHLQTQFVTRWFRLIFSSPFSYISSSSFTPLDFPSITYYLRNFYLVIEQQQRRLFGPNSYGTFRGRRKELLFSDHFFLIRTVLLTFLNNKFIGFSYYTIWRPSLPPFPLLELRN